MADPSFLVEVIKVLGAGAVGALSAILGQTIAARHAEHRHQLEMQQREKQMWAQFVAPIAARRIDAYEAIYDTVQLLIETGEIPMSEYVSLRKRLIYLPPELREMTLSAMSKALSAKRQNQPAEFAESTTLLKSVQAGLEDLLGVRSLEQGLHQIGFTSITLDKERLP